LSLSEVRFIYSYIRSLYYYLSFIQFMTKMTKIYIKGVLENSIRAFPKS
jgi:hypothetical protein